MSASNVGDLGSIPGLGRSPGERNGNPLQYSCLENSTNRGTWQVAVHGVAESDTPEHACHAGAKRQTNQNLRGEDVDLSDPLTS